jgi:serine/threonine protein kinase
MSALKHAHARGWVHLDVRPSNIIVSQPGNVSPRVQLIDFGCAAQKYKKLSQFRGCPPFAYSELLRQGLGIGDLMTNMIWLLFRSPLRVCLLEVLFRGLDSMAALSSLINSKIG